MRPRDHTGAGTHLAVLPELGLISSVGYNSGRKILHYGALASEPNRLLTILALRCKWGETGVVTKTVYLVMGDPLNPQPPHSLSSTPFFFLLLLLFPPLPRTRSSELCLMTLFSAADKGRPQKPRRDGGPAVSQDTTTPPSARRRLSLSRSCDARQRFFSTNHNRGTRLPLLRLVTKGARKRGHRIL